ncbi:MAG: PorV/PorQ family protein [candidate division KSB1 bacterium]|nr:PorV/PorQ family protein [candidate division KSB1 bacterium]
MSRVRTMGRRFGRSVVAMVWLAATASFGHAQFQLGISKVAMVAAPFLEIGVGPRAIGMGGAFVATANDATALYWNPGGLPRLRRPEVVFTHTDWLADTRLDFAGAVLPLGRWGTLGASVTSLSMDDMRVTTVEMPGGTGEYFSAGDLALAVSYGLSITDRFSIGFTGKYIYEHIWKESAWAVALDLGTLFVTDFHGLRIGAALTNFGTDMRLTGKDLLVYHDISPTKLGNNERIFADLHTDSWPLPLTFQAGVAMEVLQSDWQRMTLALDAVHPSDNTESLHLGMEWAWREWIALRAGYHNLFLRDSEEGLTAGFGVNQRLLGNVIVRFDYAWADFGRLSNVQRVSLGIVF